ncbi:MAG: hypothetical protein JXA66_08380 [Oligoflexia bacterium]|nr:hypothetical protein [Oligoflexia bacterium]
MGNRRILSKYRIGNLLFVILSIGLGAVVMQMLIVFLKAAYVSGADGELRILYYSSLLCVLLGINVYLINRLVKKVVDLNVFSSVILSMLFFFYCVIIALNYYPGALNWFYVFFILFVSVLMVFALLLWRRKGGVAILLFFASGSILGAALNSRLVIDDVISVWFIRSVVVLSVLFLSGQFFGLFGIVKKRHYLPVLSSFLLLLAVLYPPDPGGLIREMKQRRYVKIGEAPYEYVDSAETGNKRVDVLYDKNLSEGVFVFRENEVVAPYTYPLGIRHRVAFYTALLQHTVPVKRILFTGDMYAGFWDAMKGFYGIEEMFYSPFDPDSSRIWSGFAVPSIFNRIEPASGISGGKYDLIVLFPPCSGTLGLYAYLDVPAFGRLTGQLDKDGTLIVFYGGKNRKVVSGLVGNNTKKLFKFIKRLETDDLSVFIMSNFRDNITNSSLELKYRLVHVYESGDYGSIRQYLDGQDTVFNDFNSGLDGGKDKESFYLVIIIAFSIIVFLAVFILVMGKYHRYRYGFHEFIIYLVIGFFWSSIMISFQVTTGFLYREFPLFTASLLLGLICSFVLRHRLERMIFTGRYFPLVGFIFVINIVASWAVYVHGGISLAIGLIYAFLAGMLNVFRYPGEYRLGNNTVMLPSFLTISAGLGTGIFLYLVLPLGINYSNYYLAFLAIIMLLYGSLTGREKGI